MGAVVHAAASVAPGARLGEGVVIGPFAVIGPEVVVGEGTEVHAHAVILGPTVLGASNVVHPFAVVGGPPQLKNRDREQDATLTIGDRNVIREHATLHRGAEGTRVGSDNLFMVGCHVAHDATVGSHVTLSNGTQLAGHVVVEDFATFGGLSGVAQFVRVGESAFVAAGAMCERAVPPFVIVQGDRAKVRALNVVGLRRRGIPAMSIASLERAFRQLFGGGEPLAAALARVSTEDPRVAELVAFLSRERAAR